ncbi:MAG: hypothetical protein V1720_17700 [bacterium]
MSNGSTNTIEVIYNKIFGSGKSSAVTNKNYEIILKKVKMYILEMEDVLFHLNSAVMMPEDPQGKSSTDGNMDQSDECLKVSGLKALALAYKQIESDPNKLLIIAGHTDTSGTDEFNFKLSEERAENILYLLTVTKEEWAANCYARHKIEDYQQIMKHFEKKLVCGCDPGDVDDKWGPNTKTATKNFFEKTVPEKAAALLTKVENDYKKRWPEDAWLPVYDLYSEEIAEALEISTGDLDILRISGVHFVDPSTPYVGCGESFPIEEKEKSNYRSQRNRRVELIFFDKDEVPEMKCPADRKKVHKEEDCPLWRKYYFIPVYLDPNDLKSAVYHLQFVYFDKIKKKQLPVPQGLAIKVYEDGHKQIPSETNYKDGIYYIKVKFGKKLKDPARTKLYFEFSAVDNWVFTDKEDTEPTIFVKTRAEYNNLPAIDKLKYYDLPQSWSSRNYWTRYDGDINKGDRFEKVFKENLKLKPFDNNTTKPNSPLVFSLDDIVLADSSRSQVLSDKNSSGTTIPLDDNSRYTAFFIDYDTKENINGVEKNLRKLKIHNPEETQPVFTNFKFNKNLIHEVPLYIRVVYFSNDFYDVEHKRSAPTDTSFNYENGHVAGARLAIKNDTDVHVSKSVIATNSDDLAKAYAEPNCGNFELHYFNDCTELDGKPLNYLFVYWSCRFTLLPSPGGGDANDIANHRKHGMVNAMTRLNKNYLFEKLAGDKDIYIRPFHFMEAKNDTNGGVHKAMVDVVGNAHGAWMMINTARLRKRDYRNDPTYLGNPDPINNMKDTDGSTYQVLTNAHEMGHATGNWDNYLYNYEDSSGFNWTGLPRYNQPFSAIGGPYTCDELSRMYHNRTPRLRNFWKFALWMNDETAAGKSLNKFFNGTTFKITFQGETHKHEFSFADQYKNPEIAFRSQLDHQICDWAHVDLHLYKLGDDELSRLIKSGQVFDGILVVKIRLALKFVDGSSDWGNDKLPWAQQLNNDFKSMLNQKFRFETTANNDFKNVYVLFSPCFQVYSGWFDPGDSQFDIEISHDTGGEFETDDEDIEVKRDTNKNRIIRYCFGRTTGTGNLTKDDFSTILNWLGSPSVCNAAYTSHNL